MATRLEFDLRLGRAAAARPRDGDTPMRLLVLGDFGGSSAARAQRVPRRVDLDDFDGVFRSLAPRLTTAALGGAELSFGAIEEFHPDALFARLPGFQRLRELRGRLQNSAGFAQAAEELRAQGLAPSASAAAASTAAPTAPTAATAPSAESDAGTIERLLGRASSAPAGAPAAAPASAIDALIRSVVAPFIVPDRPPFQAEYVAAVEAALAEQMRQVLHEPRFVALEAAWRGVLWLVRTLPLGEELQLYVLDVTREELQAELLAAGGDPGASALCRQLRARGPDAPDGVPWALLAGLYDFGPAADDLALLAALGVMGSHLGGAFVGGARSALFGSDAVQRTPDPADWRALAGDEATDWLTLRRSTLAPWIGLAAPRLLMRLPYGAKTDPVEAFPFEEQPGVPRHDTLCWGPAALGVAAALGQAFGDGGWDAVAGANADLTELPAYTYREDDEAKLMPCAEAFLGERAGEALLARGLIPMLSHRHRAAVRVFRVQSIAEPARALAGPAG